MFTKTDDRTYQELFIMFHAIRWTIPKIEQRLKLIEPLIYRQRQRLPSFRYQALSSPAEPPPIGTEIADDD